MKICLQTPNLGFKSFADFFLFFFVKLFGRSSLQAQQSLTMTGQFKAWGQLYNIRKYFVQIYHRAFILILTSSLRGHALHIFQGQELFELIGRIVLDEVASVGQSYQGVGQVLTEDHHQVARVPDQPPQNTLALNIFILKI